MTTTNISRDDILNLCSEALINAAVSKTTGENVWGYLAQSVAKAIQVGLPIDELFQAAESKYKADFSATALPSKYRSAKSSVLAAVANGIPLMDDDGKPHGKTFIERTVKALKEQKEVVTRSGYGIFTEKFESLVTKALASLTPSEYGAFKAYVQTRSGSL